MKRKKVIINCFNVEHQNNENININHHIETNMIVNMNEIPIERNNNIKVTLPSYQPDPLPTTKWHDHTAEQFVNLINSTCDDIIHWRKNLFKLPNGKTGRLFVNELSLWFDHYNRGTDFKCIALKVFRALPCLLLQKPKNSKAKYHVKKLERRLRLWNEGNIIDIIQELEQFKIAFEIQRRKNVRTKILHALLQNLCRSAK